MKLVMGYTKTGEKMHLVDGDDLAVSLCGRKIAPDGLVRRVHEGQDRGDLILFADHWRDGATSGHDRACAWCLERERVLSRRTVLR